MTADFTAYWIVAVAAGTLQLLGAYLCLLVLRGRHLGLSLASGLLWGTAVYGVLAAGIVVARDVLAVTPLFPVAGVAGLVLAVTGGAGLVFHVRAPAWRVSSLRVLAFQAAGALLVAICACLAIAFDFSTLTPDSLGIIEAGLGLSRIDDPRYAGMPFLGSRGILGPLLHAPAAAVPFDFFWFASPLLGLSCMLSLGVAAAGAVVAGGGARAAAAWSVALGSVWLLSCYFWTYQFFYVHVNQLAGAYLFLFFHAAWRSLVDEDDRWLLLAGLALFAFQLLRVEGAFFAALLVGVLVLERAAAGRRFAPELWLILPGAAWYMLLAGLTGGDGIFGRGRLLLMSGLLLGCLPLAIAARLPQLAAWRRRLPAAALLAIGLVFLVLFALRPDHMLQRFDIFARNAVGRGLWSTAWVLVPAIALASPVLGRVPHQRFAQLGLVAWLLGLGCLTYAGHWRAGWWDSGNRMLTHVLPSLVWLGMLRAAAIVRGEVDSGARGKRAQEDRDA